MKPKRWTKKSIREMHGCIDGFALFYKTYLPIGRPEAYAKAIADLVAFVDTNRLEMVVKGIKNWILRDEANIRRDEEWFADVAASPGKYWAPPEWQASRKEDIDDARKSIVYSQKLLARVEAEGLPPEVASYYPEWIKR